MHLDLISVPSPIKIELLHIFSSSCSHEIDTSNANNEMTNSPKFIQVLRTPVENSSLSQTFACMQIRLNVMQKENMIKLTIGIKIENTGFPFGH